MRERCWVPSRHQCIRYVVSYPRLSRTTRRNGTDRCYLRFCVRAPDALFFDAGLAVLDAGLRAGARRAAGRAVCFAAVFRFAAGAAVRARVRTEPFAPARAAAAGRAFTSGTADFCTSVKRG